MTEKYDLFLSYNHKHKDAVNRLYNFLTSKKIKVWMDKKLSAGSRLNEELEREIQQAKLFMCCVSRNYAKSENCKAELSYAIQTAKKTVIPLMFENLTPDETKGIGLILSQYLRIQIFEKPKMTNFMELEPYTLKEEAGILVSGRMLTDMEVVSNIVLMKTSFILESG